MISPDELNELPTSSGSEPPLGEENTPPSNFSQERTKVSRNMRKSSKMLFGGQEVLLPRTKGGPTFNGVSDDKHSIVGKKRKPK